MKHATAGAFVLDARGAAVLTSRTETSELSPGDVRGARRNPVPEAASVHESSAVGPRRDASRE
jgi:hypothetical protein